MNSLKSIYSRITSLPAAVDGLKDLGIGVQDAVTGDMRDVEDILEDLAGQWGGLTKAKQQSLGVDIAGRFQLSRFLILMEQFETAQEASTAATFSNGSAMAENAKYLESYEAKLNKVKNAWTEVAISMGEDFLGDALVGFTTVATGAIKMVNLLVNKIGVIPAILGTVGAALGLFGKMTGATMWQGAISGAGRLVTALYSVRSSVARNIQTNGLLGASQLALAGTTRALSGALLSLVSAFAPMLAFAAIGWGISKFIEKTTEAKKRTEELKAAVEEMNQLKVNAVEAPQEDLGNLDNLVKRYKELNEEKLKGEDWDNSTEKEFAEIQNQLADIMPEVKEGIDSKGQALLKGNNIIDEAVLKTKELVQAEKELALSKHAETYKEPVDDLAKKQSELDNIETRIRQREKLANSNPDNADFHQDFINKHRAEQAIIENELMLMQNTISQGMIEQMDLISSTTTALIPEISMAGKQLISSLSLEGLNSSEIDTLTGQIHGFMLSLQEAYEMGNEAQFDQVFAGMKSHLESLVGDGNLDNLKLSFEDMALLKEKDLTDTELMTLANSIGEEGIDDMADAIDNLGDSLEEKDERMENSLAQMDRLHEVLGELKEDGELSMETLYEMLDMYPELAEHMGNEADMREFIMGLIDEEADVAEQAMLDKLSTNEHFFNSLMKGNGELLNVLGKFYDNDLNNFSSLAEAKESIEIQLIRNLSEMWSKHLETVLGGMSMQQAMTKEGGMTKGGAKAWAKANKNATQEQREENGKFLMQQTAAIKEIEKEKEKIRKSIDKAASLDLKSGNYGKNLTLDKYDRGAKGSGGRPRGDRPDGNAGRTGAGKRAKAAAKKASEKAAKAKKKDEIATREATKEYEYSIYVVDLYKKALEELTVAMKEQTSIKSQFPTYSKQYQDAIRAEIKLLKEQQGLMNNQKKALLDQVKYGQIHNTGILTSKAQSAGQAFKGSSSGAGGTYRGKYANEINRSAKKHGVDPHLIASIIQVESGFKNNRTSSAGAQGLMQLMPATARGLGVKNSMNAAQNIDGGTKYIAQQLKAFDGNLTKALAAYNAGAGNVRKYGGVPPFKETQNYVKKVNAQLNKFGASVSKASKATSSSSKNMVKASDHYLKNSKFRVSSKYGNRTHPVTGKKGKMHHGTDFAAPAGTAIKSLGKGKVTTAAYSKSAGHWVVIEQDDGVTAKYMHMLKAPSVKRGQTVQAGQNIGQVGSTGSSTGNHVHIQTERNGKSFNSLNYMKDLKNKTTSERSQEVAQEMADIDKALSEILNIEGQLIDKSGEIAEAYFDLVEAQLSSFDHEKSKYDKELAKVDYYQSKNEEYSPAWLKQEQKRAKIMKKQSDIHKNSIAFLERELSANRNLGEGQRMRLKDLLDEREKEAWQIKQQIVEHAEKMSASYLEMIEKQLATIDKARDRLNRELAKVDYYQTRFDDTSTGWATQQIKREKLMREQNKIHKSSITLLKKEIKSNKNLTKAQKETLRDNLHERQVEMWNLEQQILDQRVSMAERTLDIYKQGLEAQKDAAIKVIDEMIEEIDKTEREAEYKRNLRKKQDDRQELLDDITQLSLDDSDSAKKKLKDLTKQLQELDEELDDTQRNKGIEDRKEALGKEKEDISDHYDALVNDERKFADMRTEIIEGNTKNIKNKLDKVYKDVNKLTDELGKTTVKNLRRSIKQMNGYLGNSGFKGMPIPKFDTGGMTKAKSNAGGLAILHDKELVLNAQDTKRILEAVDITRTMGNGIGVPDVAMSKGQGTNNVYNINMDIGSLNGTKKDADFLMDSIVTKLKNRGGII